MVWNAKKIIREKQNIYPKSVTIETGSKKLVQIEGNYICKSIVIHGQQTSSSIGLRLSQIALDSIVLTQIQKDVIIGILLGDGHIKTVGIKGKPMIQFNQGFIHLPYVLFVFKFLNPIFKKIRNSDIIECFCFLIYFIYQKKLDSLISQTY